jgi:hypothetical protein
MRRVLSAVALAFVTVAITVPAGVAVSPKMDSVRGTAEHLGADAPYPVIEVTINARSGANGSNPKGSLAVDGASPIVPYRGRVTCLSVTGGAATIGIEIVKADDPTLVGKGELWSLIDGGGSGAPDRIAGYRLTRVVPTVCPSLSFNVPVVSGDYVVHDAT